MPPSAPTSVPVLTHGFAVLNVLVIDATVSAAQNTRVLLSNNGVTEVEIVRTADEVMAQLSNRAFDLLIAEWDMKGTSGIELAKRIRYAQSPINPTVPIILLTGRSGADAASEAVNAGINELYVRPLSPQGMAKVLHTVISQPRSFVIAPDYRGPDRRTSTALSQAAQENRIQLIPELTTVDGIGIYLPEQGSRLILPDFSLKAKVNRAAVASGKVSFDALETEFIRDGLSDVDVIKSMFSQIELTIGSRAPMERMCTASTLVQARSDAYDYALAARVANFMTEFCKSYFNVHNPSHKLVLEKHIQALQVILKTKLRGDGGAVGDELVDGLGKLMFKMM